MKNENNFDINKFVKNGLKCPMPDDYFYGYLAAAKFLEEKKKNESLQNTQTCTN